MAIVYDPETGDYIDDGGGNTPTDPDGVLGNPGLPQAPPPTTPPAQNSPQIPPWSMEAFLAIIAQIDPNNWERDYLRFKPYFDKWGVKPQIDSSGSFRGRFQLPGMAGFDWDPWKNGFNWGKASYDKGPVNEGTNPTGQNNYNQAYWDKLWSYPEWNETFQSNPWTKVYQSPDANAVLQDPGFQFRLDEGQKAINAQGALKGTLLGPDTWNERARYASGLASQEYGLADQRARQNYAMEYGQFRDNEQQRLGDYLQRYGQYNDAFNREFQGFGTNYGMYVDAYNRARTNQNDWFNQNYMLSGQALSAQNAANGFSDNAMQQFFNQYFNTQNQNNNSALNANSAYNAYLAYRQNNQNTALGGAANSLGNPYIWGNS